jgi:hypothetical protein
MARELSTVHLLSQRIIVQGFLPRKKKNPRPNQHLCSAPPLNYVKLGRFMGEIIVTLQTPDGGILESTQMEQAFLAMRKATLPRRRP